MVSCRVLTHEISSVADDQSGLPKAPLQRQLSSEAPRFESQLWKKKFPSKSWFKQSKRSQEKAKLNLFDYWAQTVDLLLVKSSLSMLVTLVTSDVILVT